MKFFENIVKYKYPIMVGLCFLLGAICVVLVIQGMKKDHTYEMMVLKNDLREEKNKEMQQLRSELVQAKTEKDEKIRAGEIQDSLVKANSAFLDQQILLLNSQKANSYEKNKVIDHFGSDELRNYYQSLSKYNDYR